MHEPTIRPTGLSRRGFMRTASTAAVLTSGASLLSACERDGESVRSPRPGEVLVAFAGSYDSLDPTTTTLPISLSAIAHAFESLVTYDSRTNDVLPVMITGQPRKTGPLQYTVTLREGLAFHDGTPVTVEDVAFSVEHYTSPDSGSWRGAFLSQIANVTGSGQEVQFNLKRDYGAFPFALSLIVVLPKATFDRLGADKFAKSPIGSGPYQVMRQTPGKSVELSKHEAYRGTRPARPTKITLGGYDGEAARLNAFNADQVDVLAAPEYADLQPLASDSSVETGKSFGAAFVDMEFNQFTGPFADERVRQAFMYAVDRAALIERLFPDGVGRIADSMLPEDHTMYVTPAAVYRPDADKARTLLDDAGYPGGFEFEILVGPSGFYPQLAQLIQEQVAEVGMVATIRQSADLWGAVAKKSFDVAIATSDPGAIGMDADVLYRVFNYGPNRDGFFGTSPAVADRNKAYDRLVDEALFAQSIESRRQIYAEAQEIITTSTPNNFPFIWIAQAAAWQDWISNFTAPPSIIYNVGDVRVA
jgi:peptide/nickel transport system substrate-binding protein